MMRRARRSMLRRTVPAAVIAVALTFGLAACNTAEDTSTAMHNSVVQIAERAVAGDYAGALAELALLDRDVTSALDAGRIDTDREQEIRAAIDLVRADLEAALAAATSPTPAPVDGGEDDDGDDGNGNGNGNSGNENSGNENSGNGNGNSGNGNSGNGNGNTDGSDSGDSTEPPSTAPPTTDAPGTEAPESGDDDG